MQLDTLILPDDLLWTNEFSWSQVEQNIDRSLTGGLLIQEQEKKFGRSIELSGGENAGWVDRATVKALLLLTMTANKIMVLTLPDDRQFSVIFDRSNGDPIEAQSVLPTAYPDDTYQYSLRIKLLTVEPVQGE